jgi:hypothetical protein
MKNGIPILTTAVEIIAAIAELAGAILDGDPNTKPDLNRLMLRILTALAGAKKP